MKFHWGGYLMGMWAVLMCQYISPDCYVGVEVKLLWAIPICVLFAWLWEARR